MAAILLIEDDPIQRELATSALSEAGHDVRQAPDGARGLAMVWEEKPDLVVCDVTMPGMDGFQVLASLRRSASTAAMPVIMLTAQASRAAMRQGMSAGADDYLPKPYQPEELIEAVKAVLARHDARHKSTIEQVKGRFEEALQKQEQILKAQFEDRLGDELSSRWDAQLRAEGKLQFDGCTLLLADLFGVLRSPGGAEPDPELVSVVLQAARDSLFLFGAAQVLPYGEAVLAVFPSDKDDHITPAALRAVRSAFSLQAAVATALHHGQGDAPLAIALADGDMTIMHIQDPLHGVGGSAPVPGPALRAVSSLLAEGKSRGWGVAAASQVLEKIPEDVARPAGSAMLPDGNGTIQLAAQLQKA